MDNIVEIKNVYKSYSKKEVISNMNLNIPKGKIVGLLGPNGSGKSTLIKLINGLLQPNSGDVLIDGIKPSIETKRIVSYLPERTYLNDWMKVSDILNFFNDFYDDFDIDKAMDMVKSFNIDINELCKTAINLLSERIIEDRKLQKTIYLNCELIIRKSFIIK